MNDKYFDFAKKGVVCDTVAKFTELFECLKEIDENDFELFIDWLEDVKELRYNAVSRIGEIQQAEWQLKKVSA
ncbi:MAG: hypothetical protein IJP96_12920 [Synergistaceae bacterium]|nr:hypothetical protein [Synergistaceae bacterium]MBR0076645.1 hypothetical protein [Synergistaceae bacterium]MBR0251713.1 hypothetical protein [Synergistaceae bacterium]MBR0253971.1 hypothetical protein [Synergistaceae bacterium]